MIQIHHSGKIGDMYLNPGSGKHDPFWVLDVAGASVYIEMEEAREMWRRFDRYFHNEMNTKAEAERIAEAAASTQTALDTMEAWTTDEGFVADHV